MIGCLIGMIGKSDLKILFSFVFFITLSGCVSIPKKFREVDSYKNDSQFIKARSVLLELQEQYPKHKKIPLKIVEVEEAAQAHYDFFFGIHHYQVRLNLRKEMLNNAATFFPNNSEYKAELKAVTSKIEDIEPTPLKMSSHCLDRTIKKNEN